MNMFSTMQSLGVDTSAFHPKIHPKIHLHRSLSVVFFGSCHTVDRGNPAPVSRWYPLQSHYLQCFIVPNNYQLVQDFFHPQYQTKMAVHSRFKVPDVSKSHVISTNIYIYICIYIVYIIYMCVRRDH